MILVICMAGLNTRFHDAGFDIPKYLLPWKNKTVIHEILSQLTKNFTFAEIILVANIRDAYFRADLEYSTSNFNVRINYIGDTKGQAETAAFGSLLARTRGPIVIHNADTIVTNRDFSGIENILLSGEAYVDVFAATDPAYCYVNTSNDYAYEILEKKEITGIASSGLYGFSSGKKYFEQYQTTVENKGDGEVFISDVLTSILDTGGKIKVNKIHDDQVTTVIGSPREYREALNAES